MACWNQFIAIYELWIELANELLNMNDFCYCRSIDRHVLQLRKV